VESLVGTAARRPSPHQLGLLIAAGGVLLLSAADGGFFPSSWRWGAVAFAAAGCVAVLLENRLVVSRAGGTFLAGLILFAGWTTLSAAWSLDPHATLLETQRLLLYAAALAAFLAARRGLANGVVLGATAVAVWALADRFLSRATVDPFEGKLLSAPLGYANALGALLAIAAVASAVAALRFRLAAVPLIVLVPALALTNSRGAVLAGVVGLAIGAALAFGRRLIATAIVAASISALVIVSAVPIGDLGDRSAYWGVARAAAADHPLAGAGAGTFAEVYRAERPQGPAARNAHSLYLETLDELGVVGLVLLLATLAIPVVAGVRRGSAAAPAVAAYATFLLHAGIDWDWTMPAVAVAALALGAAVVAGGRPVLDKLVSSH
jgi:O-antigen ligase